MINKNFYNEWKLINENNTLIDSVLSRYLDYKKFDIESLRCDDGNIYYYGDLSISSKPGYYPELPDNFIIYGYVNLINIKLKKLPKGLVVHGDLICGRNKLTEIPTDIVVYGVFDCSYNKITEIPPSILIKGDFRCTDNKLKSIPSNLNIGEDIYCDKNDFKITKTIHHKNIYVDEEYQELQDRIMKLNKIMTV